MNPEGTSERGRMPEGNGNAHENRFYQHSRQARDEAQALASSLGGIAEDAEGYLRTQFQDRPYAVLAACAGLGYIIGGGLPSKLTRLLMGSAVRLAASALLGGLVVTGVAEATESEDEGSSIVSP